MIYTIGSYRNDDKAFIFTLKNPYGVEPTQYMKRGGDNNTIYCHPSYGPTFGGGHDIYIYDNCNNNNSCFINNDGSHGYDCHQTYKRSLFVNTNGPNNQNNFTVLDYEVFAYN